MQAFELAASQGAQGVELDIRPCKTGEIVVFHDATLTRCSGGADHRRVCDVEWQELSRLDLGAGARIPLLAEVLSWAAKRGMLVNVEMKRDVPRRKAFVAAAAELLRAVPDVTSRIIVSSFDGLMLARLGGLLPDVARGLLFEPGQKIMRFAWAVPLVGASAVHPERTLVTPSSLRMWRLADRLVNVWTVNDPEEAQRLASIGVDGLITDRPAVIVEALHGSALP